MTAPSKTLESILAAAGECFSRFSIKKTTVDDICRVANVSRPTFYRFFKNKNELVLHMAGRETLRNNAAVARFKDEFDDIEEAFVEAMCYAIGEARKSDIVGFLLMPENMDATLQVVHQSGADIVEYKSWETLFKAARARKRLRPGVDVADAIRWLAMIRTMLLMYGRPLQFNSQELHHLVRSYVVPALFQSK